VQGDWAEACSLIMRPRGGEKEEATDARRAYAAKGDAAAALRAFPPWMHVERSLLEGYRSCGPRAHSNALQRVPRNMRLMYVHAFQVRSPYTRR
jgi:tRNA pseudouridine13 synthase